MKDAPRVDRVVLTVTCAIVVAGILPCAALGQSGESPWLIRARFLGVVPDDDSSTITVVGGKAEVDEAYTGDVDFSYFFTDNIAAELTLAVAEHDVSAKNTILGDADLGSVKLLPPTLTLQYHFIPDGKCRPYVGAGVNYTIFFDDDPGDATSIDYDDSFGFALQAGIDIGIDKNWAINFDVKKIWLSTDVTAKVPGIVAEADVDIDPWLFGVGLAYRF
ncbi:MAG: OmpW/AlkL family protein [Planctomycetota bacterium]|jgi:outer membrane protein